MVIEYLLECREVRLRIGVSVCQRGVGFQIVAFCKVGAGEVNVREVCVWPKDLVRLGEASGSRDGKYGFQLEYDILLCNPDPAD